jgi:heat shock protein HslJ
MRLLAVALVVGSVGMTMKTDLSGGEWRPSEMSAAELPAQARMFVEFTPGGQITGSGGCNRFFGGYAIEGNTIKIGPIASTRKGCPGITPVEMRFFAALESATTFERDGDKLVLYDASGEPIVWFDFASKA